ncbi:hypothetical protein DFH07DRAFT_781724 [Mycena maculata]|uniref:Uncharacterized protein n=1 Tax=Mycena maculata TaxID=230809 RepID=A0AAD7HWP9_9AGAR|nr:hypothetical protein DFH07DRAFT_781724 [Mycena maculata]
MKRGRPSPTPEYIKQVPIILYGSNLPSSRIEESNPCGLFLETVRLYCPEVAKKAVQGYLPPLKIPIKNQYQNVVGGLEGYSWDSVQYVHRESDSNGKNCMKPVSWIVSNVSGITHIRLETAIHNGAVLVFVVMDTPISIGLLGQYLSEKGVGIKEIHQIGCIGRWAVQIRLVLAVQIQSLGVVAIEMETLVVRIGSPTSLYIFAKFPQQIWLNVVLFITVPYEICFNICNGPRKMLRGRGTQPIMGP